MCFLEEVVQKQIATFITLWWPDHFHVAQRFALLRCQEATLANTYYTSPTAKKKTPNNANSTLLNSPPKLQQHHERQTCGNTHKQSNLPTRNQKRKHQTAGLDTAPQTEASLAPCLPKNACIPRRTPGQTTIGGTCDALKTMVPKASHTGQRQRRKQRCTSLLSWVLATSIEGAL